ncbi:hypothetical protein B0H13DRAFT_2309469 [Mycena leptocephala]|nr:hypothetical protein B0H13DRAFT_2309469 [Mycena leptocephala]
MAHRAAETDIHGASSTVRLEHLTVDIHREITNFGVLRRLQKLTVVQRSLWFVPLVEATSITLREFRIDLMVLAQHDVTLPQFAGLRILQLEFPVDADWNHAQFGPTTQKLLRSTPPFATLDCLIQST